MEQTVQWLSMATGIVAAVMVASKLSARVTGWGFVIFAVSSVGWVVFGFAIGETPLIIQNAVLVVINLIGVWRYLIVKEREPAAG
jgi:uncharacterized protein with PQ loop repeat